MVDIKALESKLNEFNELRDKVFKMERALVEELYQLEKDTFDGLKYMEFVNKQNKEIQVNDKIHIRVHTYSISGIYKINNEVSLELTTTVYTTGGIETHRVIYPNRETRDLPKKYQKEYDELVAECSKFKIENPSKKYQDQYKIHMY